MPRPVRVTQRNQKPEAEFKRAALKWLKLAYGPHFFHLAIAGGPYQRSGSPDYIFCIRGLAVFAEFKAPGGRVGPRQAEVIAEILAAGGRAGVVSCWDDLRELLKGIEPVQKGMMI